jgi:MFS family permease
MTTLLALIGVKALIYLYIWLLASVAAGYLSDRKGYGEKAGLATGICLTIVGTIIWLVIPARPDSKWKSIGPFGRGRARSAA